MNAVDFGALMFRPNPVVFDVGANAGQSIEWFKTIKPDCFIHAFEPDESMVAELQRKFAGDRMVKIVPSALGNAETEALLRRTNKEGSQSLLAVDTNSPWARTIGMRQVDSVPVRMTTIDRYCDANGIQIVDFLKLDVQGFEPECLMGASHALSRGVIKVIQVEIIVSRLYERVSSFLRIESLIAQHGFFLFSFKDVVTTRQGAILQLDAIYTHKSIMA